MPLGFKILVELGLTVSKSIAPYWLVDGFRFLRPIFTSEGKGRFLSAESTESTLYVFRIMT